MNNKKLQLLFLEDSSDDAELMIKELQKYDFNIEWERVETKNEFTKALEKKPDVILADYNLPTFDGLTAIKIQQKTAPEIPLIVVSGIIGEELAVRCLKAGATDYVLKDRLFRLPPILKRTLKEVAERSEFKKANEALKESEKKYQAIFEATGTATLIVDEDTTIVNANKECKNVTGYSISELIGKSWTQFAHKEDLQLMMNRYKSRRTEFDSTPDKYEVRLIDAKGDTKNTILSIDMMPDTKRSIVSILDITERKKVEKILQENEEKYKTLFDVAHDAIIVAEVESGIIVDANNKALELTGYSIDELIGKHQTFLHPINKKEENISIFKNSIANKGSVVTHIEVVHKNKNLIPVEISSGGEIQISGKAIHIGVFRDVSIRKQAEEALNQSEEKYRNLVENIEEGIASVDENDNFSFVNSAACKIFGYSKEELLKMNFKDLLTPENQQNFLQQTALRKKGETGKYDIVFNRKNGDIRVISSSVSPLIVNGEFKGSFGIFYDITERKKAEQQIKKSNEELAAFNKLAIGRELRMIELKSEINELLKKMGKEEKYKINE